jgi:hypothetical protein
MSKKKVEVSEVEKDINVFSEETVLVAETEVEAVEQVSEDNISFATPQLQEAWTGEKPVEVEKEVNIAQEGEYEENDWVTFRLKSGNLHFGRYGAIVKMGYKAEGLYSHPKKK